MVVQYVTMQGHNTYSELSLIRHNSFSKNIVYYRLTGYSLVLVHISVLGKCGRIKGLEDKAMAD